MTKDSYSTVRFGNVAHEVTESTRSPLEDGFEYYIGLEHLDPESLKIRRWGLIEETETTFTRIFRAGQVLFGRRRAYQRKAALAGFDGICSGDIIVMEAKPDRMLPELLPFIVQTEGFYQHALSTSAGSLSPRTKWSALAKYEFPLPPLDEQRRIAEILWAVEDTIEAWQTALSDLRFVVSQTLSDTFNKSNWGKSKLGIHVAESAYGPRFGGELYSETGGVGFIRTTDLLEDGTIIYSSVPRANLNPDEFSDHILRDGDFMISRSGTCGIGCVYEDQSYPVLPGAFLIRLRLKNTLNPYYLKEYVNSPVGKHHMNRLAQGAVQRNIRGSLLLEEEIPIPSVNDQEQLLRLISDYRSRISMIEIHLDHCQVLKKSLLNTTLDATLEKT